MQDTRKNALLNGLAFVSGPALGLAAFAICLNSSVAEPRHAAWTALITVWCAAWWMTEVIPIPVTSLLPIAVFPLVGVLTGKEVGQAVSSKLVLLMMGGFMLSTAMQRSGVHRRLAILMIRSVGGESHRRLILGFMLASAVLSMWIANAATVLMLLPIALAACEGLRGTDPPGNSPVPKGGGGGGAAGVDVRTVRVRLLLGIAYAASLGGIATPIGTPPNLVFLGVYKERFGIEPSFLSWMSIALPVLVVMFPITVMWLTRGIRQSSDLNLPELGPWRPEESRTLIVFSVTALLWVTRKGWSGLHPCLAEANDASVALLAVVTMFLIPRGNGESPAADASGDLAAKSKSTDASPSPSSQALLDWETAANIQWGVLLLFGGGLTIAKAFERSGLSDYLAANLSQITAYPPWLMVGLICLAVTFLTEITSNTATTTLLMPILAATAVASGVDGMTLMAPATLSASFAFMLPVATPTNAIAFSGSEMRVSDMAREGLALNLIGVVVITVRCLLL